MTHRTVTHATFVITRDLTASPQRVFAAFADPDKKYKWFTGPKDWRPPIQEMDFRIGGHEISIGGPVEGPKSTFNAIYQDIVPDERIIYSYDMLLDDTRISVSVATIEFRPDGEGTRLVLTEQGAYLDGWDHPGQREAGTRDLLDALDAWLAGQAASA